MNTQNTTSDANESLSDMFFEQPVNLENRKDMVDFLKNHYRYYTMNSWNRLTSWANKVKIHQLNLPRDVLDAAYKFMLTDVDRTEWDEIVHEIIHEFENSYNGNYTIHFNGRSGGHLVLNTANGRRITDEPDADDIATPDFPLSDLKENVELVIDFDRACDRIRLALIDFCREYEIVEETDMVKTTYLRMRRKDENDNDKC